MISDDDKHRVAMTFLGGLLDRDFERMGSVLHADATWSLPGDTAVSGVAHGRDAVVERGRAIVSGGVDIELVHVLIGLDNVAVQLHNTGRKSAAVLDEHLTTVFSLDGSTIVAIETLISDVPGLNAFFAAPD